MPVHNPFPVTISQRGFYLAAMFRLTQRLQSIYDLLIPEKPVWDLCCDHGKLGFNAAESGNFSEVHFVDQVPEIIERIQRNYREYSKYAEDSEQTPCYFHPLSGAELSQPLKGTVVIAGVGSHTVEEILNPLLERGYLVCDRLIIASHNKEDMLNAYSEGVLKLNGFVLSEKIPVVEAGRTRNILKFDRSQ